MVVQEKCKGVIDQTSLHYMFCPIVILGGPI